MRRAFAFILIALCCNVLTESDACTSVIVSGKATESGRPLLYKHRDSDDQNNRVEYFKGERFDFIGLVNSDSPEGEVWTGINSAGFCIMNTASYNFREDSLDQVEMDREGQLMYDALSTCETLEDFEHLLEKREKPMGVEANFGVIDAQGGAAYYETNNFRWVKFDVNETEYGYRVVTNFCESGRREDYEGWERYLIASEVMKKEFNPQVDHRFFFNRMSRNETELNGAHIPRDITSAAIVVEGVKPGEDPKGVVMWTILGHPLSHIAYPLTIRPGIKMKMKKPKLNLKKEEKIRTRFERKRQ